MKRGATREEIIRTTQELITRNGIRALRVDEIAQRLGISKRTLYEMFTDKNELVTACLDHMSMQQQQRIAACRKRRAGSSLQKMFKLTNEYIDGMCSVDQRFLSDICRKVIFAQQYDNHREFMHAELTQSIELCCREELILGEIDASSFVDKLMNTLLELRLMNTSREELYLFCRTILRGAATRRGIEMIDRQR